jgi:uncharacterized membrane protein
MGKQSRLQFIDLLRGAAVIVMVEVHVFNAFLQSQFRATEWFTVLNYINGLVAPSFVFISGFVFIIASQRKLDEYRTFGNAFWKQIWRIALIWIVGYSLHLPYFSFHRMMTETSATDWLKFYQADVLHCIAVGLLCLFILRIQISSRKVYEIVLLCIAVIVVALTPFVWKIDFLTIFPAPIAAYFNGLHYSQFPLFPWSGFMFFAGYAASKYLIARENGKELSFMKRFGLIGMILFLCGGAMRLLHVGASIIGSDVRANPFFFVERLGLVMALLFLCWSITQKRTPYQFILASGRQSLLAYASHLVVIYGRYLNGYSLAYLYKRALDPIECTIATLALITAVALASFGWDWLKRNHLPLAQTAFGVFAVTMIVEFFIH